MGCVLLQPIGCFTSRRRRDHGIRTQTLDPQSPIRGVPAIGEVSCCLALGDLKCRDDAASICLPLFPARWQADRYSLRREVSREPVVLARLQLVPAVARLSVAPP